VLREVRDEDAYNEEAGVLLGIVHVWLRVLWITSYTEMTKLKMSGEANSRHLACSACHILAVIFATKLVLQ
jgi:hypothetical protein